MLDDGLFDHLDRYRGLVDPKHASSFAGGGTNAAGELRKVIGRVQDADRRTPAIAINEIVPIGNDVVQRAAGVAERHPAIHAASTLGADLVFAEVLIDLEPIVDPFGYRTALRRFPRVLDKAGHFTHGRPRDA